MGLKITKKQFFQAYSNFQNPNTIRSHQKRVKVLPLGSRLGSSFSLSHRLKDLSDLIKVEKHAQDKRRLIEIGKFIYLNESHKHGCLINLVFAIRNALLGRGFCTAKKIYSEIQKESKAQLGVERQTQKRNQTPQRINQKLQHIPTFKEMWIDFLAEIESQKPEKKPDAKILPRNTGKLFPKKIPPLDPNSDLFFKDFNNNFLNLIKPLDPKEIEQRTLERKAPFNLFYSKEPDEETLEFMGKNLSIEQLLIMPRALFFGSSSVLCNYCICIQANPDKNILFQDLMEYLKTENLLREIPELSGYTVHVQENKQETKTTQALFSFAEFYIRIALKAEKITESFALLNHFHEKDSLLMYLLLKSKGSSFVLADLPERESRRFFIWSSQNLSFNKTITPYFCDMSSKRFNAAIQESRGNSDKLAEIFCYLHHTPHALNDQTRFGKNLNKAMPLFPEEEVKDLAEKDFFKLSDKECSKWKLELISSALTTNQFLKLIEGSLGLENSLVVFRNLACSATMMIECTPAISKMQSLFKPETWTAFFLKYGEEESTETFASIYLNCLLKETDSSKLINLLDQLSQAPPLLTSVLSKVELADASAKGKKTYNDWIKKNV